MKIIVTTSYSHVYGAENTIEFEMDDDATLEEIEEEARQAAFEDFEWNYTVVRS